MRRRQLLALSALAPLALVACTREPESTAANPAANFSYSPAGYDGVTVTLDRPAERIAMDYYSAAALAPYGIAPVAVFGFGKNESPGRSFDSTGVEVVGADMELDTEALAAAAPDIIVAYGNDTGDGWTWWDDKLKEQVSALAPFVPVKLSDQTPDEMFAQYAAIAQALGADTETDAIASARQDFDDTRRRIRDITAQKDWLSVLLANFNADIIYTAKELGVAPCSPTTASASPDPMPAPTAPGRRSRGRRSATAPPMSSSSTTPRRIMRTIRSSRPCRRSPPTNSDPGTTSAPIPTTDMRRG